MRSSSRLMDEAVAKARRLRDQVDGLVVVGFGIWRLVGPDGRLKIAGTFANLITDTGDEVYAKRGAGASTTLPTGMRLGTGTTAVAKNGAGAAIVTYKSGSHKAFEATYPSAASKGAGAGWRVTYRSLWAAGTATQDGLSEVVITNESPLTDVAGNAGNTVSRALLSPVVNKGANDTLTVDWYHDFLGA